ncbi:protein vav isoform X2 [Athalia rosae]|uniref:protein vav isoform X2 n=1 Tax=Athalia rosae TaxID=37344 RepID=UPI000625335C|nr:protein vav isoform X2 [Athalia rosae]
MSSGDGGADASNGWHECAKWLTRCGALRSDHKANWPSATAFDLAYTLRDGVLLCNLLNAVDPGCVDMKDVNQKPQLAQFLCLRNIKIFLSACSSVFGLADSELFEPSMLFDLSNFHRVLCTLSALSICPRLRRKGIEGFYIGRDHAQEDIYKDLQSAGVGPTAAVVAFTIKPRGVDLGESQVYQELLCFSTTPQHDWPSTKEGVAATGGEKYEYVVKELVETEHNYSEVLGSLLKHFARPLASILHPEESARIFFGIKELSEIHSGFHSQLRKARHGAELGQVFLDWRQKFLIYGDYCANLTAARNTVQDVCARNELINQEVIRCQKEANDGKFKLRDILSVPMQRVLKYHLLLEKLVEEAPRDWIDHRRQLEKAREAMVDVAQYINEVKRDSDTIEIIRDIQASIVDWDAANVKLEAFGRLLKDGELKVKPHDDQRSKARWAFVFEQAVVICKAGRGDQYCYKETLRLDDYRLEDRIERRTLGRDARWSFQWLLVHKQGQTAYTLYARTDDQKQTWIKALRDAMDNVNPAACKSTDHKFRLTTFDTAISCQHCGKFLKGRIFQGYRCSECHYAVHKQCITYSGRCMPTPPSPPPPPPSPCERALSTKLWFVGGMERKVADLKLEHREDGTYMLRVRNLDQPRLEHETKYALSIKADGAVKHIKVFKRDVEGAPLFYLSESRYFKSVVDLVEHYERASLGENFDSLDQRLLWPFRRVLAKALFDFKAEQSNQLSLRQGYRVVVLSKEGDAKGWWKGKIGNQVGFFPKEYVAED